MSCSGGKIMATIMTMSEGEFHKVASVDEIAEGAELEISIGGWDILVCRHGGKIYAVENRCSHRHEKLVHGRLRRGRIICPVHGAHFDLASGAACGPPATCPIATFAVRNCGGILEISVPAASTPRMGPAAAASP
jgi:3-phenylpropionate/trans-cinnamate dioxygenase ferredoxin subunit